jgi:hypothetical protein
MPAVRGELDAIHCFPPRPSPSFLRTRFILELLPLPADLLPRRIEHALFSSYPPASTGAHARHTPFHRRTRMIAACFALFRRYFLLLFS